MGFEDGPGLANALFDSYDDSTSSDDESFSDEFSDELAHIDLISPEINEADFDPEEGIRLVEKLLYDISSPRPMKELNSKNSNAVIESFSPSLIPVDGSDSLMDEIDIFLALDDLIPPGIENDDYDSKGDILFLKELLTNDSLSLPENESFHFDRYYVPKPDMGVLTAKFFNPVNYTLTYMEMGFKLLGDKLAMDELIGLYQLIFDKLEFLVIHQPPQDTNTEILQARENLMEAIQAFIKKYDHIPPREKWMALLLAEERFLKVKQALEERQNQPENYGDEHLDTIPATKSDEFIKSCVENLVPNLSESEGENGCDVPSCFTTFSNILFDADYDFESVDDQSLHNEDVSEKIFSNPLFEEEIISIRTYQHHFDAESDLVESILNRDSSVISSSSKIDSLLDEFVGELTLIKSIPPGIDKADCHPKNEIRFFERLLYDNSSPRPPEEFVFENSNAKIESFSPSPIPMEDSDSHMEEIDLSFKPDDPMPPSIEDDDNDSERDNLFLGKLLHDDPIPLPDTLDFSNVVRVFLPFFTYLVTSSILLPSGSEDTIFDPGITINYFFRLSRVYLIGVELSRNSILTGSFSPSPIPVEGSDSLMEEIDIFLASDDSIPSGIENDDYDSEGDIFFLEEMLTNDSLSLPENESFHFDRYYVPSSPRPLEKPPDDGICFDI
nr:hypothetical protein [Tanacetum cinerariifolium]